MVRAVRMGELAVSGAHADELAALGLGSCIGLALVDRVAGVAGLAHIVLPDSGEEGQPAGKFADLAVPELVARMVSAGAVARRLEAVIAGGGSILDLGGELDIGPRNESAVRAGLARAGIRLHAAATGGSTGRTLRVSVRDCEVTVREPGGETVVLLKGAGR